MLDQGQVLNDSDVDVDEDIIDFVVQDEMGNLSLLDKSDEEDGITDFICMGNDGSLSTIR
ncbi:hypothetical protein BCON_0005g00050 [Botryotinia convoluta]|uniref:Uncharacterized protein n=1 Tax=Botryotinia convoluta TaxID=54673 RepID=A0A4Z1ITM4_9HELO|nr:hypothetical protein BCON_0005g00050 [Botryotinia convoluta]